MLILGAGIASAELVGRDQRDPSLPTIGALTQGRGWQVDLAYAPGDSGGPFRQWLVRDRDGTEAELYVGATSHAQVTLRWSGELGYQGEGYLVTARSQRTVRLDNGATAPVSRVFVQRLAHRLLLEYAVVRPDGVAPSGTSALLGLAWNALSGRPGPYYLVRVSAPENAGPAADQLLATVLSRLSATARTG